MARVNIGTHASGVPVSDKEYARDLHTQKMPRARGVAVPACAVCIKNAHLQHLEKISVAKESDSE
jgi:hypothetical protein